MAGVRTTTGRQASTGGGPASGRTSIGMPIGTPPGPGDDDAFAAMAYARPSSTQSTTQKPMRNSLPSGNGPSLTAGAPSS